MKTLLITNPLSGNYNSKKINFLINSLNKKNFVVERYDLKVDEPISNIISTINPDIYNNLIFAFGDGTINSACNALLKRNDYNKFNILIFPAGTANVVSMELNCNTIKKSINAFLKQNIKKVHIGMANNRYFIAMASSGFDAVAAKNVNKKLKKLCGKLAYIWSAFRSLFKKKKIITTINGQTYENILTCASNGKYYGVKIKTTNADLGENIFDVVIIKKINIFHAIKYLLKKETNGSIIYEKADKLKLNMDKGEIPFQLDGDCFGNLPLTIKSTNKYLNFFTNN